MAGSKAISARGDVVDFDLLAVKQKLAAAQDNGITISASTTLDDIIQKRKQRVANKVAPAPVVAAQEAESVDPTGEELEELTPAPTKTSKKDNK